MQVNVNFACHKDLLWQQASLWRHRQLLQPALSMLLPLAAGNTLCLPHVSPEVMDWLVGFIYGRSSGNVPFYQTLDLFSVSHRYHIPELYHQCERMLSELVTIDNCRLLARLADQLESQKLQQVTTLPLASNLLIVPLTLS